MAVETTANEKIVFAKSYTAHAAGSVARPVGLSAPRPPPARVAVARSFAVTARS
jgi:hypothetical protein